MNKRIKAALAAILIIMLSACSGKTSEKDTVQSSDSEQNSVMNSAVELTSIDCQTIADSFIEREGFEGVVMIAKNGEVTAHSATGTDIDGEPLYSEDSLFCIGSLSKQFAAVSVMMLSEQGKLNLDDALSVYFPDYIIGQDIEIKNLLAMRSGIPEYFNSDNTDEYADEEQNEYEVFAEADAYNNKNAIKEWIFNQPLDFEPDRGFEYSNSNYLLLADIVEQVSGVDYHSFLTENIFKPLKMSDTGFIDDLSGSADLVKSDTEFHGEGLPGVAWGAGDIVSDASDMMLWLSALRENKLISAGSYRKMTTDYSLSDMSSDDENTENYGYGYGMMIHENGGAGHAGKIGSYTTVDFTNPDLGYDLFIATVNTDMMSSDMTEFTARLIDKTMK